MKKRYIDHKTNEVGEFTPSEKMNTLNLLNIETQYEISIGRVESYDERIKNKYVKNIILSCWVSTLNETFCFRQNFFESKLSIDQLIDKFNENTFLFFSALLPKTDEPTPDQETNVESAKQV